MLYRPKSIQRHFGEFSIRPSLNVICPERPSFCPRTRQGSQNGERFATNLRSPKRGIGCCDHFIASWLAIYKTAPSLLDRSHHHLSNESPMRPSGISIDTAQAPPCNDNDESRTSGSGTSNHALLLASPTTFCFLTQFWCSTLFRQTKQMLLWKFDWSCQER